MRTYAFAIIIGLSLTTFVGGGRFFSDALAANPIPLCPASLRSDDPDFSKKREHCDFNRKKLPACPLGTPSLGEETDWVTGEPKLNPDRRECTKDWTVIAFLAMDNDLVAFGEENLNDLAWGKATDKQHKIDLVVQANFRNHAMQGKRYVFESKEDGTRVTASVQKDFSDTGMNTGDPKVLEEFLAWAVEEFPSQHYFIVMGGHGDGWAATVPKDIARAKNIAATSGRSGNGIAYDQTHDDWLAIPDLSRVLRHISEKFLGDHPIDVYAADACLMQQAEVAFELRHEVDFIYGSLPIMAYQGLPYLDLVQNFAAAKYPTARDLALDLPHIMVDSYKGKNDRVFASVVDTKILDKEFSHALNALGKAGQFWLKNSPPEKLLSNIFFTSGIGRNALNYQSSVIEFRDFLDKWSAGFASQQAPGAPVGPGEPELLQSIANMKMVLDRAVVSKAWGPYYEPQKDHLDGLSIWFPSSIPAYQNFQDNMLHSNLHRIREAASENSKEQFNDWGLFLRTLFVPQL